MSVLIKHLTKKAHSGSSETPLSVSSIFFRYILWRFLSPLAADTVNGRMYAAPLKSPVGDSSGM